MTDGGSPWPDAHIQALLRACFVPGEGDWDGQPDAAAERLLPLLAARRGEDSLAPELADIARRVRLLAWRNNRDRLSQAAEISGGMARAGIEAVMLKGVALVLSAYRECGLRPMDDVDFLVAPADTAGAVQVMVRAGWRAEHGLGPADLPAQMRIRHAWQFTRGEDLCDLHWHPVVRCYSPRLGESFRRHARTVTCNGTTVRVPDATELLFQVIVHGLQWSWTSPVRWVADAMTLLESAGTIDWDRLLILTAEGLMTVRMLRGLEWLRAALAAPVPDCVLEALRQTRVAGWERSDCGLMVKRCPLHAFDRVRWHRYNLRRIRRFDPGLPLLSYLAAFMQVAPRAVPAAVWQELTAGSGQR